MFFFFSFLCTCGYIFEDETMHTFCILKASYPLDMFPENLLIIKGGQNIFVIANFKPNVWGG